MNDQPIRLTMRGWNGQQLRMAEVIARRHGCTLVEGIDRVRVAFREQYSALAPFTGTGGAT